MDGDGLDESSSFLSTSMLKSEVGMGDLEVDKALEMPKIANLIVPKKSSCHPYLI